MWRDGYANPPPRGERSVQQIRERYIHGFFHFPPHGEGNNYPPKEREGLPPPSRGERVNYQTTKEKVGISQTFEAQYSKGKRTYPWISPPHGEGGIGHSPPFLWRGDPSMGVHPPLRGEAKGKSKSEGQTLWKTRSMQRKREYQTPLAMREKKHDLHFFPLMGRKNFCE